MDSNYIERHLLVDRYIQGKLDEHEQQAFEERLVWDKALVDEVELAERLRAGLKELSSARADVTEAPGFDLVAVASGLFAIPQFAAAASFLLAVSLTIGVLMSPLVDLDSRYTTPSPETDTLPLLATRGANSISTTLAKQTDIVPLFGTRSDGARSIAVKPDSLTVLLIDVTGDYPTYRVTVRRDEPGSGTLWMQDGLMPTYPESLAVTMPGNVLAPGRYVLTIEAARTTDTGDEVYQRLQDIPFITTPAD